MVKGFSVGRSTLNESRSFRGLAPRTRTIQAHGGLRGCTNLGDSRRRVTGLNRRDAGSQAQSEQLCLQWVQLEDN
jgi:hypothetical protein